MALYDNDVIKQYSYIIIDLKVGERADPKTLKDLRFSESPLEIPAYHEGASARLPTHQAQVTPAEVP